MNKIINPISTEDTNSFAYFTLVQRLPAIIQSVIEDNDFEQNINEKIRALIKTLPNGLLPPFEFETRENKAINRELIQKNYHWNKSPFLFLENYLYHKLYEITEFPEREYDYFAKRKTDGVLNSMPKMISLHSEFKRILELEDKESLKQIILLNLLGNKADLSQSGAYYQNESLGNHLLINHTSKLNELVKSAGTIDIVLDNAGEELFSDLLLAYWFLQKTSVVKVNLHFKTMPYFVSDAMISDFDILMGLLSENPVFSSFLTPFKALVESGKISLCSDPCWSSGILYRDLPDEIYKGFNASDLVIFKGDLNYRKLVGDFKWNHTCKTESIVTYLPTAALIVRILKSEVVVGIDPETQKGIKEKDWMYNGNYGILEICTPAVSC